MTATRRAAVWPPLDAPVPHRVYWIFGPHPVLRVRVCVYIGKCVDTANRCPRDRFAEHLDDKPWEDTIATRDYDLAVADGTLVVSTTVYPTNRTVLIAERDAIIRDQPLYNVDHNLLNANQIPLGRQAAQRADRDRARGVPKHRTWAVLHGRETVTGWRRSLVWWRKLRRRQRQQIISAGIGAAASITLALILFLLSSLSLITSVFAGAGIVGWLVLWLNKPTRRRRVWYELSFGARWGLLGAVLYQVVKDLGVF